MVEIILINQGLKINKDFKKAIISQLIYIFGFEE